MDQLISGISEQENQEKELEDIKILIAESIEILRNKSGDKQDEGLQFVKQKKINSYPNIRLNLDDLVGG